MADIRKRIARLRAFVRDGIWDLEPHSLPRGRRFGVSLLRVAQLVLRGFHKDECPLHASSLTFSTLMSIVPVLALSLSIAKGFGAGDALERRVRLYVGQQLRALEGPAATSPARTESDNAVSDAVSGFVALAEADAEGAAGTADVPAGTADAPAGTADVPAGTADVPAGEGMPDATADNARPTRVTTVDDPLSARVDNLIVRVFGAAENANFAALGGVGLAILLLTVVNVLGQVEMSFNRVWGVTQRRPIFRRFTDYLSMLLILPLLLLASSSLPLVQLIDQFLPHGAAMWVHSLLGATVLKNLMIFSLVTLTFTVFLKLMPNTLVRLRPALAGGLVAAGLFSLWVWFCVWFQVGVTKWDTLFGGFAIVLIVLFWVYVSWAIVLLGAEVAFAVQNCTTFRMEQTSRRASVESRILLALSVVAEMSRMMLDDAEPSIFDAHAYARERDIPVRLLNEVLDELEAAGFVAPVTDAYGRFALVRAPDRIHMKDVVDALMKSGTSPETLGLDALNRQISDALRSGSLADGAALSKANMRDVSGAA